MIFSSLRHGVVSSLRYSMSTLGTDPSHRAICRNFGLSEYSLKTTNWDVTVFLYTNEHPVPGLDPLSGSRPRHRHQDHLLDSSRRSGWVRGSPRFPLLLTGGFFQLTYKRVRRPPLLDGAPGVCGAPRTPAPSPSITSLRRTWRVRAVPLRRCPADPGRLAEAILPSFVQCVIRVWLAWLLWSFAFRDGSAIWQATGPIASRRAGGAPGHASRRGAVARRAHRGGSFQDTRARGDPVVAAVPAGDLRGARRGAIFLDRLLSGYVQRLVRACRKIPRWLAGAPRVVIVGIRIRGDRRRASDASCLGADHLDRSAQLPSVRALLYQVATATLSPADIALPIRHWCAVSRTARC